MLEAITRKLNFVPACAPLQMDPLLSTQGKARLGAVVHKKNATALAITTVKNVSSRSPRPMGGGRRGLCLLATSTWGWKPPLLGSHLGLEPHYRTVHMRGRGDGECFHAAAHFIPGSPALLLFTHCPSHAASPSLSSPMFLFEPACD